MLEITDGIIEYNIFNTKNVDNVSLVVDSDIKREEHNELLCSYLNDSGLYKNYLFAQCKRLAETQEMPIIDRANHVTSLKEYTKTAIKTWLQLFKHTIKPNDFQVMTLLRNDSRRSVLIRNLLNNKKNQ